MKASRLHPHPHPHPHAPRMFSLLLSLLLWVEALSLSVNVEVLPGVINILDSAFVSWNLDPSCNRGFSRTVFTNPNLIAAAAALAPSRLRVGGSGADAVVYGLTPGSPECAGIPPQPPPLSPGCDYCTSGCLNGSHLETLFSFAQAARADVIFGVSMGIHEACAAGDSFVWATSAARTNADNLLAGLRGRGIKPYAFELGNEVRAALMAL